MQSVMGRIGEVLTGVDSLQAFPQTSRRLLIPKEARNILQPITCAVLPKRFVRAEEAEQKRRLDAAITAAREEDARRQEREEEMSKDGQDTPREDASMKHIICSFCLCRDFKYGVVFWMWV